MRDLISAMRSRAISASRLLRRSLPTNVDGVVDGLARELGDVEVAEAHVQRDRVEPLAVAGFAGRAASPSSHSFQAASSPLCSSSNPSSARPVPKQPSHQPCLELNENRRGSSSAKLVPQEGQARLMLNTCTLGFFAWRIEVEHVHQALAEVQRLDDIALEQ